MSSLLVKRIFSLLNDVCAQIVKLSIKQFSEFPCHFPLRSPQYPLQIYPQFIGFADFWYLMLSNFKELMVSSLFIFHLPLEIR